MAKTAGSPMSSRLGLAIRPAAAHNGNFMSGSSAGLSGEIRAKVMKRDEHICTYCGFQSFKYQEVRSRDPAQPARFTQPEDWVTTCHICDQCLSLERVGFMGEGLLIWLPELSQTDLNHLVRSLYIARSTDDALADTAKRGIDSLRSRRDEAKRRLGTDDPMILATVLGDHGGDQDSGDRQERMEGIRFLSLDRRIQRTSNGEIDRFPEMIAYWKSKDGPFAKIPVATWVAAAAKI